MAFGTNFRETITSHALPWTKLRPSPLGCGAGSIYGTSRMYRPVLYTTLLINGKLNSHLAEIDNRATKMFNWLMKQLAEKDGITEQLKAQDQMAWVQRMNNISNTAEEIVNTKVIYA